MGQIRLSGMGLYRFYCENIAGSIVELSEQESRHIYSVKRLGVGEEVELFDGAGCVASAVIESVGKRVVRLAVKGLENQAHSH